MSEAAGTVQREPARPTCTASSPPTHTDGGKVYLICCTSWRKGRQRGGM